MTADPHPDPARARRIAAGLLAAVVLLAGCAHNRRIVEVNAFEAGYFTLLVRSAYDESYAQLHSDAQAVVSPADYKKFYTVLTDAFGQMAGWEKVPGPHDQHIPLLERERRRDPLPIDDPKAVLQSRYKVKFADGTVTFLIRTSWEGGRMTIRGQVLCCLDQKTVDAIQARAKEAGAMDLFESKPRAPAPAPAENSPAP